jgi:undecaprenyl-diphosphatase
LGFIQGTTEWLPISSTGHLRLAEIFFGLSVPLLFDVALHVGTLFVILIYFRRDVKGVLTALWHRDFKSANGKLIVPIIIGSIPPASWRYRFGNELDRISTSTSSAADSSTAAYFSFHTLLPRNQSTSAPSQRCYRHNARPLLSEHIA